MIPQTRTPTAWRTAWRDHLAPSLGRDALESLAALLVDDDPRLTQGDGVQPSAIFYPGLEHDDLRQPGNQAPTAACFLGWLAWYSGCKTTATVEEYVHRAQMGDRLDALIDWYDETPRDEMRRALLPEVKRSIALKARPQHASSRDCGA